MDEHDRPTLMDIVAAALSCSAVAATIYLACYEGDAAAKTGLTGLIGASSAYFLTKQVKSSGNGKASSEKTKSEGVTAG